MPHSDAHETLLDDVLLMEPLSKPERALVAACFELVSFEYGETIIEEGDEPDAFFVIASGSARVLTVGADGREVPLNILPEGASFGELALVEHKPRFATVRAASRVEVLRLDRSVFLALLQLYPELTESFGVHAQAVHHGDFLRLHPAFFGLPRPTLTSLVESMTEVSLADGEAILPEGGTAPGIYLVSAGRLQATETGGEEPYTLHVGDVFGEQDGQDGPTTIRALGAARLLHVDTPVLRAVVREHPEVGRRLDERAALVAARRRGARAAPDAGGAELASVTEETVLAAIAEEDAGEAAVPSAPPRRRRARPPAVRQLDQMDCGAACVATLCRYYGHDVSLPAIRSAVGTSLDGTSVRGIMRGGSEIGIEFRTIKSSMDRLDALPKPLILHWGGNHWVVLHELWDGRARLADPAFGLRAVSREDVEREWTGYAVLPTPTERLAEAPRGGLPLGWLRPFVRPHVRVLAAACALALLATGLQMLLPVLTQVVVDELLGDRDAGRIHLVVGGMALALLLAVGATLLQRQLLAKVAVAVDGRALDFLAERLLRLPLAYFNTRRTADIQRRLEGMRQIRRVLVEDGVLALTAAFQLVAAVVILTLYSWAALLLFLAAAPAYALLMRYSRQRLRPTFDALEEAFGKYQARQLDAIKGIEAVKVAGAERGFRASLLREFEGLQQKLYRSDVTVMVYTGLVQLAALALVTVFLWVGALLVLEGQLTVGELVAINALVLIANAPITIVLGLWDELQLVAVLLGRLQDVHEQQPEQDPEEHLREVPDLGGHVRMKAVGFRYPTAPDRAILDNISLDVPAGTTVALVGRSGSGKSSLLRCLAGLLIPTEGAIEYDDADLRELRLTELRRKVGFVLQEPYLFDDTITANIAFGREQPDPGRIQRAAEIANAAEFIEGLPLGYETRVGDAGLRVSTGQAQRIAIARAVYERPPVLLLDEATSALDSESERAVKEGIDRLLEGRTAFVVAHRMSTIRDADLICVLEQGRLVEQGTHEELVSKQGLYAYLYSQQLAV